MKNKKIVALVAFALCSCTLTGCASFQRSLKSWDSNMQNGLQRSIEVYDINGEKIKEYSGKFDYEFDDKTGRILFDDENNKRHVIFPGTSTILIDEQ